MFLVPLAPLSINLLEVSTVLVVCSLWGKLFLLDTGSGRQSPAAFAMAGLFFAASLFSVSEATQFLTVDDQVFAEQILNPADRGVSQWSLGAFHTGLLILVPVARLTSLFELSPIAAQMTLKAVWFGIGMTMMLFISGQAAAILRSEKRQVEHTLFIATILILLPTNNLALETLNYDLLSVSFALAGLLIAARQISNDRFPVRGVALAALAAQEKLSASPILLLIIVSGAALTQVRYTERASRRLIDGARNAAAGVGIAAAVTFLSTATFALLGPQSALPSGFWWSWTDSFTSWTWAPLIFLGGGLGFLEFRAPVAVGCAIAIAFAGGIARWLWPIANKFIETKNWTRPATAVAIAILVCGVIGALGVRAWWSPYHSADPAIVGGYFPMNGVVIHFDSSSLPEHFLRHFLYGASIVLVALPSALALMLALALVTGQRVPVPASRILALAIGFLVIQLTAATAFNVPIANRYLNIGIAGLGLTAAMLCIAISTRYRQVPATVGLMAVVVALLVELAPFRPTHAAFRPFWLDYPSPSRAEPGGLNPSWVSWGEELMLAGKQIENDCLQNNYRLQGVPCGEITLRTVLYSGRWLPGPKVIRTEITYPIGNPQFMTERDYYVLNRLTLMQGLNIPQIAPDYTVDVRGFTIGWVWRGDRLKAAGYTTGK